MSLSVGLCWATPYMWWYVGLPLPQCPAAGCLRESDSCGSGAFVAARGGVTGLALHPLSSHRDSQEAAAVQRCVPFLCLPLLPDQERMQGSGVGRSNHTTCQTSKLKCVWEGKLPIGHIRGRTDHLAARVIPPSLPPSSPPGKGLLAAMAGRCAILLFPPGGEDTGGLQLPALPAPLWGNTVPVQEPPPDGKPFLSAPSLVKVTQPRPQASQLFRQLESLGTRLKVIRLCF